MRRIVVTLTQEIALGLHVYNQMHLPDVKLVESGVHLGNGKLTSPFLEDR